MSTVLLPKANVTVTADSSPSGNSIAMRDSVGNLNGNIVTGSTLVTTGNLVLATSPKSASFTADNTASVWTCDCTAAAVAVTLPSAASSAGWMYVFIKTDSSSNHVTFSGVVGSTAITAQGGYLRAYSDGTSWYVN